MKLLEPMPERRREVTETGVTPTALLERWAYLAYAILKFVVGGVLTGFLYLFAFGSLIELGIVTGTAAGALALLGFIPVGKLFYAWAFPIQY